MSPSFRNAAVERSQSLFSKAGIPDITLPSSTLCDVADFAVRTASSPTLQMAGDADLAGKQHAFTDMRRAGKTRLRTYERTSSSTVHECPICTRLSIFAPRLIRVSPTAAAIDRGVDADLDIVLDHNTAGLRNFSQRFSAVLA